MPGVICLPCCDGTGPFLSLPLLFLSLPFLVSFLETVDWACFWLLWPMGLQQFLQPCLQQIQPSSRHLAWYSATSVLSPIVSYIHSLGFGIESSSHLSSFLGLVQGRQDPLDRNF